jgi:hypothetical protein
MEACETAAITDVIVGGIERIEIFGGYARIVYWQWRYHRGMWVRATVDVAIVRPLSSFNPIEMPLEVLCPRVVRIPGPEVPVILPGALN